MEEPSSGEAAVFDGAVSPAAEFPCCAPSGARDCWANTVEAIEMALSTAIDNTGVVGRKPRLLAFLGLASKMASRGK
jgi:hypothetical protein